MPQATIPTKPSQIQILDHISHIEIGLDEATLQIVTDDLGEIEMTVEREEFLQKFREIVDGSDDEFVISNISVRGDVSLSSSNNGGLLGALLDEPVEISMSRVVNSTSNEEGYVRPPQVPKVDAFDSKTHKRYYEMLTSDSENQARTIRKVIYNEERISLPRLEKIIEKKGYSSSSSGIQSTLRMLDTTTGEIKRIGLDDDRETEIVWVGT